MSFELNLLAARDTVSRALAEDLGWGDLTTDILIAPDQRARALILAKGAGVLAGGPVLALTFQALDADLCIDARMPDGAVLSPGDVIAQIEGRAGSILHAERVALNFLQRMSGIASLTNQYVRAVDGLGSKIIDTRKTSPGLRLLEKYAVRTGGGVNHRFNLSDGILIKDNHLAALRAAGQGLPEAVARLHKQAPHGLRIQVEVESEDELQAALDAGVDAVLLDNMPVDMMRRAVARVAGRVITEASGGITLATVRQVAETGVDLVSVGALTHSAPSLDISLDFQV